MIAEKQEDGSWLAEGDGYDRYILSDADTREEAIRGFNKVWGDQYARSQVADHLSLLEEGKL